MRYKRVLSVILAAAMIFAVLPAGSAFADDAVDITVTDASGFEAAWSQARKYGGTIHLGGDITITKEFVTDEGDREFTLDLNGFALLGNGSSCDYMIRVAEYVTFTVTDLSGTDRGYMQVIKEGASYDEMILVHGTFYLNGGILKGNNDPDCKVIYVDDELWNTYDGLFVMNGGLICSNFAYNQGSAVHIEDGAFMMYGGTIAGNVVSGFGGAVYVASPEYFIMEGGTIEDNYATDYMDGSTRMFGKGGGIYNEGTTTIYGGTIRNNYAGLGGGIYSEGSILTIGNSSKPVEIVGNTAARGGGLFTDDDDLIVKYTSFKNNSANESEYGSGGDGGAIWFDGNNVKTDIHECEFIGNSAQNHGGALFLEDGYVQLTDSIFKENSSEWGGAVYTAYSFDELFLKNETVMTENTATGNGAAIYMQSDKGRDSWFYTKLHLGGRVRVAGNTRISKTERYENDVYMASPVGNCMIFDSDIDCSPDHHAWIGITGKISNDIMISFAEPDMMMTVFGTSDFETGLYNGDAYFGNLPDMTHMKVDPDSLVTMQGAVLGADDYSVTTDDVNCIMTISTHESVSMDGKNVLIMPVNEDLDSCSISVVSFDFFLGEAGMNYKYVYRVHSTANSGNALEDPKNKTVSRDVYWYVNVIKEEHYVAEVDGEKFTDMQTAYTESQYKVRPIELLDDVTLSLTGRDCIPKIILNGHSVTFDWKDDNGNVLTPVATQVGTVTIYTVPYVYAKSVSTKGELLVNFYVNVNQLVDKDTVAFRVEYGGETAYEKLIVASSIRPGDDGYYKVSVPVPAKEMGEPVIFSICDPDDTIRYCEVSYSVEDYYRGRLEKSDQELMRNLSAAALNYGAAAQRYFGWNEETPVNAGIDTEFEGRFDLSGIAAPETPDASWEIYEKTGDIEGFGFFAQTVVFKEQPVLRFYLDLDQINIEDLSFSASMGTLKEPAYSESEHRYYVDVTDISARNILQPVTLSVTKGEETTSLTYSISTYIYRKYSAENGLGDLVKAMYTYCLAAKAWAER